MTDKSVGHYARISALDSQGRELQKLYVRVPCSVGVCWSRGKFKTQKSEKRRLRTHTNASAHPLLAFYAAHTPSLAPLTSQRRPTARSGPCDA